MPEKPSGDKTEKATPKKRRDAREKGQIFKSTDLVVALSMIVLLGSLRIFGPSIINNTKALIQSVLTWDMPDELTVAAVQHIFLNVVVRFMMIMLPILASALLTGLVFNYIQVGFMFSSKAMMPKFSRVNPLEGFKRIFSKKTVVELVKSVIKIAVLGVVAYNEYINQMITTPNMMAAPLTVAITAMVDMIFGVGFKMALVLIVLAPFDLLYQWWSHEKDLMMTKQEVKDEYKLTEGDPQIKGRIRQKQRQMSAMRMMQAMATADVVITNPTHYAIALSYDEEKNVAPIVVAKGKDFLAQKIKEEAAKRGIHKVENRELAQYLYFFCDVGDEVPEEMYHAVAEILAYIYKLKQGPVRQRGVR